MFTRTICYLIALAAGPAAFFTKGYQAFAIGILGATALVCLSFSTNPKSNSKSEVD